MTHFLTPDTQLPPYMAFPRFLLDTTHKVQKLRIPEGRTYSPPDNIGRWYPLRGRALCEADAAPAEA